MRVYSPAMPIVGFLAFSAVSMPAYDGVDINVLGSFIVQEDGFKILLEGV